MIDEYKDLAEEIIYNAIASFNLALINYDDEGITAGEEFFRSQLCEDLMGIFTDRYDAERCIDYLTANADYKRKRKELKCGTCKERCIHKSAETACVDFEKMYCNKFKKTIDF